MKTWTADSVRNAIRLSLWLMTDPPMAPDERVIHLLETSFGLSTATIADLANRRSIVVIAPEVGSMLGSLVPMPAAGPDNIHVLPTPRGPQPFDPSKPAAPVLEFRRQTSDGEKRS